MGVVAREQLAFQMLIVQKQNIRVFDPMTDDSVASKFYQALIQVSKVYIVT